MAMFRSGRLRLLLTLAGLGIFGREDVLGAQWSIPSSIPSQSLEETHRMIQQHCNSPIAETEESDPRDLIRRQPTARSDQEPADTNYRVDFGNDSEGEDGDIDSALFPPNIRSRSGAIDELRRKRNKRGKQGDEEESGPDEETLEARRQARQDNALARQRKIKSDLYIHASDEDTDEEGDNDFFAREEQRRKEQAQRVRQALLTGVYEEPGTNKRKKRPPGKGKNREPPNGKGNKRRKSDMSLDSDKEDEPMMDQDPSNSESMSITHETPPTSTEDATVNDGFREMSPDAPFSWSKTPTNIGMEGFPSIPEASNEGREEAKNDDDDDGDEDDGPAIPMRRPRVMAGFVIDSDSD